VTLQRGIDGSDPLPARPEARLAGAHEHRRTVAAGRLGTGTLACPRCDAPVAPPDAGLRPAARLGCPFCGHAAAARDFLSLAAPARPARVAVLVELP
jgi:hypothetical protein